MKNIEENFTKEMKVGELFMNLLKSKLLLLFFPKIYISSGL